MDVIELRRLRAEKVAAAKALSAGEITDEVRTQFDAAMAEVEQMDTDIARAEKLAVAEVRSAQQMEAPAVLKIGRGDTEERAVAHFIRTGDASGMETRSNANDMTIADATYAGNTVPTGHYQGIIAKRDATLLAPKLGVMNVPGRGTTTNVPYDNGTANAFVSTAETTAFDVDAPVTAVKAFTLVKYTKQIVLSYELLQDEDSKLMAFITDYVGRALALTHNTLLITEALAAGTSVALSSVTSVAAGDPQTLVYTLKQEYADNAQFIMAGATYAAMMKLAGDSFQYAETPGGTRGYSLWGYPVQRDANLQAIGSGNKSILFGNFRYMGLYESPTMEFLRDPYSKSGTGQIVLNYYFRADYGVMLPEAILYGAHPTG